MTSNDNNNSGAMPPQPTATSATASGCPVLVQRGDTESSMTTRPGLLSRWFSPSNADSNAPVSTSSVAAISECHVKGDKDSISECPVKGKKSIPASIEEAANHSQIPHPGQRISLSTQRVISSIPRGDVHDKTAPLSNATDTNNKPSSVPHHQPTHHPRWQYPSEQQFYNAMRKKGYRPPVESIPSVLQIHNAVNERSWVQLCKWEKELHNNQDPKLVKFVGRPKDLSPRAWWNSRVFMTQEPFDRHDWYVEDAEGGEPRRYVIDFYEGKEKTGDISSALASAAGNEGEGNEGAGVAANVGVMKPPSMYIDVRPALDNPSAAVDRIAMFVREALPGIAGAWDSYKTSSPSPSSNVTSVAGGDGKNSNASGKQ